MLDDETLLSIKQTAKSIHPNAVLVGEPWGKRYFPQRMSELEFGVWNDVFRNGVKGENPFDRKGFIFGQWERGLNKDNIAKLLTGSLQKDGGLVPDSRYTVNYLASHDGYTLGDFIRLSVRKREKTVLPDHRDHVSLDPKELAWHKMFAFILACSQGIMMMHAGQEFARSKVIAEEKGVDDPYKGELDHDSYNKDNDTNYLNFEDLALNQELYEYYRGMIALRKAFPELRSADRLKITVLRPKENEFAVGYVSRSEQRTCAVLINASPDKKTVFELDGSSWTVFADRESASVNGLREIAENRIELLPGSPLLLLKN